MTFAPGYRLAYDRDGSAVYRWSGDGTPNHPPQDEWKNLNNEDNSGIRTQASATGTLVAVILPVPVHLKGAFAVTDTNRIWKLDTSQDSANGWDGTWVERLSVDPGNASVYRTGIAALDLPDVIGVRIRSGGGVGTTDIWRALHLYVAEQVTFLRLWHPTDDIPLPHGWLDWGTVYAGEANTKQFRIKNLRGQTAQAVAVDALAHTFAESATYHSFSLDGSTFSRPLDLGDMLPGATSSVITVRYAPPESATVAPHATQISAIPAGWVA